MRGLLVVCLLARVAAADGKPPPHLAAFKDDAKALAVARALFDDFGDIATAGSEEHMDGGYRGPIHLVPALPIHDHRKHLEWVASAMRDFDAFFATFTTAPSYRWKQLTFQFVRSVKKRTPSAYATGWSITHNVNGSLLTSERGVRETYFHELFHLNDEGHKDWSAKTLGADYAAIVKKCGTKVTCLDPYAPNNTKVRATGTYYAFQPNNGNGVHEYAAELAVRYFKEQSEMATASKLSRRAFKCGPPENARAWRALVDEFFSGHDRVPPCT
jgi:outer membrane protein assembly factor BamB